VTPDERSNSWRDLTQPFRDAVSLLTHAVPGLSLLLNIEAELSILNAELPLTDFSPLESIPGEPGVAQYATIDRASKSSGKISGAGPQQVASLPKPTSSLSLPGRSLDRPQSPGSYGQGSGGRAANKSDPLTPVFPVGTGAPAASRERKPPSSDERPFPNRQGIEQGVSSIPGKSEQGGKSASAVKPVTHTTDDLLDNEAARQRQLQATPRQDYEAQQQGEAFSGGPPRIRSPQQVSSEEPARATEEGPAGVKADSYGEASSLIGAAIMKADHQPPESGQARTLRAESPKVAADGSKAWAGDPSFENEAGPSRDELMQVMAVVDRLADEALQQTRGRPPAKTRAAPPARDESPRRSQADFHSVTVAQMKRLEGDAPLPSSSVKDRADAGAERITLYNRHSVPSLFQNSVADEGSGPARERSNERSANGDESASEVFSANAIALISEVVDGFIGSRMDYEARPGPAARSGSASEGAVIIGAAPIEASAGSPSSQGQFVFGEAGAGLPLSQIQPGFSPDNQPAAGYGQDALLIKANTSAPAAPASSRPIASGQPAAVNNPDQQLDADKIASLINDVLVEQARRHGVDIS
jgi:hypothetical protein